ncbi:MAG TPA: hypothetical protein VFK24_10900 [Gammaproteobacteria bacterium]|nr:hypothetical protein [Gammaproteobacteria bacterium]
MAASSTPVAFVREAGVGAAAVEAGVEAVDTAAGSLPVVVDDGCEQAAHAHTAPAARINAGRTIAIPELLKSAT